jgi:hypothetical protein
MEDCTEKWLTHLNRMDSDRLPELASHYNSHGCKYHSNYGNEVALGSSLMHGGQKKKKMFSKYPP